MKKRSVNRRKLRAKIIGAAVILTAALVLPVVYRGLRSWELEESEAQVSEILAESLENRAENNRPQIYYKDRWYVLRDQLETVLLIGLDKFEQELTNNDSYRNDQQADFLLLMIVDHEQERADILQIDRDTMAKITRLGLGGERVGSIDAQLALAHTYGTGGIDSCYNTVEAVSDFLFGVKIDHFLSVTMDAVPLLNDAVGGVTVEILDDLTSIDPALKQGETLTLRGEQALTYVRTRKGLSDSSNIHRMERQRQYMKSFYLQAQQKAQENETALLEELLSLSTYMTTDYTLDQLTELFEENIDYSMGEMMTIEGESIKGKEFMEFYADDALLQEQLIKLLYEEAE